MTRRERAWSKRLQVTQGCARKLTARVLYVSPDGRAVVWSYDVLRAPRPAGEVLDPRHEGRRVILADVIRTIAGTSSVWAFVLACALAVTGCAPKGSSGPPRTFDPQAMTFLPGLTPHQEGRVREAWAFYLERWNRDEGPVAPWRSVTIVPGAEVRPGVGGEVRDGRRVFIASDPEEVATAVYHELGHLRLMDEGTDGDPQHLDQRWTVWQARRQQAVFDLIDWRVARYGRSGP